MTVSSDLIRCKSTSETVANRIHILKDIDSNHLLVKAFFLRIIIQRLKSPSLQSFSRLKSLIL